MTGGIFCDILIGLIVAIITSAEVAELAYAYGSGPYWATIEGSTPSFRTNLLNLYLMKLSYSTKFIIVILSAIFLAGCAAQGPYLRLDTSLEKDIKTFNGTQYVPLAKLCDVYGLSWKWDTFTRTATIEKKGVIVLRAGSDKLLINGTEKKLEGPVVMQAGAVFVPISFVRNGLGYIVTMPSYAPGRPEAVPEPKKSFTINTIMIDPGHGGKDPGAIGKRMRLKEKHLNLALATRLKDDLEKNGMHVIMTRYDDTFIPLPRRTEMANKSGADLFVSVHINASRTRTLSGFECYYLSEATDDNARAIEAFENSSLKLGEGTAISHSNVLDKALWDMTLTENRRESAALASHICGSVENSFITRNRGIRTARFYVLKGTRMPAVLIEAAYISNKNEEAKLSNSSHLDRMADILAKGILEYRDEYERTEGFTK